MMFRQFFGILVSGLKGDSESRI